MKITIGSDTAILGTVESVGGGPLKIEGDEAAIRPLVEHYAKQIGEDEADPDALNPDDLLALMLLRMNGRTRARPADEGAKEISQEELPDSRYITI